MILPVCPNYANCKSQPVLAVAHCIKEINSYETNRMLHGILRCKNYVFYQFNIAFSINSLFTTDASYTVSDLCYDYLSIGYNALTSASVAKKPQLVCVSNKLRYLQSYVGVICKRIRVQFLDTVTVLSGTIAASVIS